MALFSSNTGTVARSDRIVVLDQGRIVETGTHAELMIRAIVPGHTSYRALVQKQTAMLGKEDRAVWGALEGGAAGSESKGT